MARIAFVVGEDFEDSELKVPYDELRAAGHGPHALLDGVQPGAEGGTRGGFDGLALVGVATSWAT